MNRTRLAGGLIALAAAAAAVAMACGGGAGAKVEALAVSGCDRGWVLPATVSDTYKAALGSGNVTLYAVYRPKDTSNTYDGGFGSQYVMVLATDSGGVALHVKSGRVTWIEQACKGIGDLVTGSRVDSFVISPTPAGTSATSGIPEVDHLIESAVAGKVIELASLAGYQHVGCVSGGSAAGPPCHRDVSGAGATP